MRHLDALALEFRSGEFEPELLFQDVTHLLQGDSRVLVYVGWMEWDGRTASNPLGFPEDSITELWGNDEVMINLMDWKGEFGVVNDGALKVVQFTQLVLR